MTKDESERCVWEKGEVYSPGPAMYEPIEAAKRLKSNVWVKKINESNFNRVERTTGVDDMSPERANNPGPGHNYNPLTESGFDIRQSKGTTMFPRTVRKTFFDQPAELARKETRPGPG